MPYGTGVKYKWTPERLRKLEEIYKAANGDLGKVVKLYGLDRQRIRYGLKKLGVKTGNDNNCGIAE